jgi:hypothetical protein
LTAPGAASNVGAGVRRPMRVGVVTDEGGSLKGVMRAEQ